MKRWIWNDSYRLVNLIFAGIIIAIFLYSLFYGGEKSHPIPSASEIITGKPSISSGLSRSFSAIVRLDFETARIYNPYGLQVFLFFMVQLLMRTAGFFAGNSRKRSVIIIIDSALSVLLFFICFMPFILDPFKQ